MTIDAFIKLHSKNYKNAFDKRSSLTKFSEFMFKERFDVNGLKIERIIN